MENAIGGLFKQQTQAEHVYKELQQAGFDSKEMTLWMHKENVPLNEDHRVSLLEIGLSALIGGIIGGIIALIIGILIGLGAAYIPGLRPDFSRGPFLEMIGLFHFVVSGGLAGIILGAAIRLFTSRENARISSTGIHRGGVLLVVNTGDDQKVKAQEIMKANGALDAQNLTEKWDSRVWEGFKEVQPSGRSG